MTASSRFYTVIDALEECKDGIKLAIKLSPGASANRILHVETGGDQRPRLKACVTAAPEKGKANKALIVLLSKHFKIPKSQITICSGETSRLKTVCVSGDPNELRDVLQQNLTGTKQIKALRTG